MRAAWWWIDRWRKSTAFTDMTLAEQGAYRNLLDELWLRGGLLPNDERVLGRACGDQLQWQIVRDKVLARFVLTPDGWRNETHDEIQEESQKRASKQKRYREGYRDRAGNVTGNVTSSPSPSPSPSPSKDPSPSPLFPEQSSVEAERVGPVAPAPASIKAKKLQLDREAAEKVIAVFNKLFGKGLKATPGWTATIADVLAAGYTKADLVAAFFAAKHGEDAWYRERPGLELFLRYKGGNNAKSGQPARKHLDELIGLVPSIDMAGLVILDLAKVQGAEAELRRRGAKERHKPIPSITSKEQDLYERERERRAGAVAAAH